MTTSTAAAAATGEPVTRVVGASSAASDAVLTAGALEFLGRLHRMANDRRLELLALRPERRAALAAHPVGTPLEFPRETAHVRAAEWRVAAAPADLEDRRVEITGPVERK